jgi:hypothetical protein
MALDLHLTSLRQALQEVTDAPAADRRVFVETVRASHSLALLGVLEFQATACNWTARNIGRLRAVTTVAGCCETIVLGLLRILNTNPTRRAALTILDDLANYAREKVGTVGGEFTKHATRMCGKLNAHGATARRRHLLVRPSDEVEGAADPPESRHLHVPVPLHRHQLRLRHRLHLHLRRHLR